VSRARLIRQRIPASPVEGYPFVQTIRTVDEQGRSLLDHQRDHQRQDRDHHDRELLIARLESVAGQEELVSRDVEAGVAIQRRFRASKAVRRRVVCSWVGRPLYTAPTDG
jgi:hypothetical protein